MPAERLSVVYEGALGRTLTCDSMSFVDATVRTTDVVVAGSYAGRGTLAWALRCGVKAAIAHAAGVGKDQAGISGLTFAQQHGMPAAAVETMSARLADGASVYHGVIGYANEAAQQLGVRSGQHAAEAAQLLLHAAPRRQSDVAPEREDVQLVLLEQTPRGSIYAAWGLPVLRTLKGSRTQDVFVTGTHTGLTLAQHILPLSPRGVLANDAGRGMDDSGVAALPLLNESGIAAAAVDAMSARIGDALSTYRDGICSAVNAVAQSRGVTVGMPAHKAAKRLLRAELGSR